MEINAEELVTELSMTYSYSMHLILEGNDDVKFFKSALNHNLRVNYICAYGAETVIKIIDHIESISNPKFTPTLGIIDRDYRIPLNNMPPSCNLMISDLRDLECMMFASPSFESVTTEFGSPEKIKKIGGHAKLREIITSRAKIIGAIRYYSQQSGVNASFKNFDLEKLLQKSTISLTEKSTIEHLNARQTNPANHLSVNIMPVADNVCSMARCPAGKPYFINDYLLCRGHDLMQITAIGLRSFFGNRSSAEASRENVESLFRLSYTKYFSSSSLANSITQWLNKNQLDKIVLIT